MAILETDPLDVALDPATGDLPDDGVVFGLIGGLEAVAQLAEVRLSIFFGEWFANRLIGFPWFEEFLGEKPPQGLLEQRVREHLLGTDRIPPVPGAVGVQDVVYGFDPDERKSTLSCTLKTLFGDTDVEVTSSPPEGT